MANSKELRLQLGLTMIQLSELIGCTPGQLAMAETGQRKMPMPSQSALEQLEQALQILTQQQAPFTLTKGKKTTALAKKALKSLNLQLKTKELKAEKLMASINQTRLRLQLAEQYELQPFLPDDGIAPLRMKILQKSALQQLDALSANLLQVQMARTALQAQINLLNDF